MTGRLGRALLTVLLLAAAGSALTPAPARGAEYTMVTAARYVVEPDERRARVSIEVTFTNTTPDPAGQFSLFPAVDLAIHDTASEVEATDDDGDLETETEVRDGVNVATVSLREPVRFEASSTFTVTYTIPDGETPQLRIRPSIVVLPIWSFGTSGTVRVELPSDFNVRADGDPLTAEREGDVSVLESGPISDPTAWLALVTADRETAFDTLRASVDLASGPLWLSVRAFSDDVAWGEAARDLLVRALPLIEERVGLDRSPGDSLVVIESAPIAEASAADGDGEEGDAGEPSTEEAEIRVGFDEPPFTLLHQAAHLWIDERLLAERWSREGLASYVAGEVADELEVALPYDPLARREERSGDAIPLAAWRDEAQDAYGHPASWAFFAELDADVGADAIREALRRIDGGRGAYDGETVAPEATPEPADARQLLDQLELTGGADLAARFVAEVFGPEAEAEIEARAEARAAYASLLEAAGEWGPPDPARRAMEEWRFADAREGIADAIAWLRERDALIGEIEDAGLEVPTRLEDRYRQSGGGPDADEELEAEAAVVAAYRSAQREAAAEPGIFARVGLAFGPSPEVTLASAGERFGEGDLRGAADGIAQARERLAGAEVVGLLRAGGALLLVVAVIGLVAVALRRWRPVAGAA